MKAMNGARLNRRRAISAIVMALVIAPAFAADDAMHGTLRYRGFAVDMSAVLSDQDLVKIESAVKQQIDIVADSGAKADVLAFFRGRQIALTYDLKNTPGEFTPAHDVRIQAGQVPDDKPILLHELLHAYHCYVLPNSWENSEVQGFYDRAKQSHLYPAREIHDQHLVSTDILTNVREFFAVTASVYLWGHVDREPYNRERLKMLQPDYYGWLGLQFGVQN